MVQVALCCDLGWAPRRRVQKIGRFADFTQATWAYGAGWGKSADFLYSVQLQGLREACALGVGD